MPVYKVVQMEDLVAVQTNLEYQEDQVIGLVVELERQLRHQELEEKDTETSLTEV